MAAAASKDSASKVHFVMLGKLGWKVTWEHSINSFFFFFLNPDLSNPTYWIKIWPFIELKVKLQEIKKGFTIWKLSLDCSLFKRFTQPRRLKWFKKWFHHDFSDFMIIFLEWQCRKRNWRKSPLDASLPTFLNNNEQ